PRADRSGTSEGREPVAHPRKRYRGVDHRLLVARLVVAQPGRVGELRLEQRLPNPGHVAVAQDAPAPLKQLVLLAVTFGVLVGEEAHHRLADGEAYGIRRHDLLLSTMDVRGTRGSVGASAQLARTHSCTGSSHVCQAR